MDEPTDAESSFDAGVDPGIDRSADPSVAPVGGSGRGVWSTPQVLALAALVGFIAVLAMLALQSRVDGESADSVDVGFLQDMIHHHEQAIELGLVATDHATDHEIRHFGQESIVTQQWEIGYMTAMLEDWGFEPDSSDRDSMAWMDMRTPLSQMPGMATAEQMTAFAGMQGSDVDREFIRLMTEHHRGGIHMAEYAAQNAGDPRVRGLAARMVGAAAGRDRGVRRPCRRAGVPALKIVDDVIDRVDGTPRVSAVPGETRLGRSAVPALVCGPARSGPRGAP